MGDIRYKQIVKGWLLTDKYRLPIETRASNGSVVLVEADGAKILCDVGQYEEELRRGLAGAGVKAEDITHVFITHMHGDHIALATWFPQAKWLASAREIELWKGGKPTQIQQKLLEKLKPAPAQIAGGVEVVATPGHTAGSSSLRFTVGGKRVMVVGDAVMTREYFRQGEPYHNVTDWNAAKQSIGLLGEKADLVIPGHGPAFDVAEALKR